MRVSANRNDPNQLAPLSLRRWAPAFASPSNRRFQTWRWTPPPGVNLSFSPKTSQAHHSTIFRACSRTPDAVPALRRPGPRSQAGPIPHGGIPHPGRHHLAYCRGATAAYPRPNGQDPGTRRYDLEPERPNRNLEPCLKYDGTLAYGEDRYGPYVRCLHCGKLVDLLAAPHDAPAEAPDFAPSPVVRNPGRLKEPITRERREKYRQWCAIIRNEGLTVTQAAQRFGVSYRTIYRILHRYRPEPGQPGEPGLANGIYTGRDMGRLSNAAAFTDHGEQRGQPPIWSRDAPGEAQVTGRGAGHRRGSSTSARNG